MMGGMVSVGTWFRGWHRLSFGMGGIGLKFWRGSKSYFGSKYCREWRGWHGSIKLWHGSKSW